MVIDWGPIVLVGFFVLLGIGAFVAAGRIMSRQNAGIIFKSPDEELQDLATKRGARFIEKPGLAGELCPILPWDRTYQANYRVSSAVEFRTHDADGMLFRIFLLVSGNRRPNNDAFIAMNTRAVWPRFELYVVSRENLDRQSFMGGVADIIGMFEKAVEGFRGLHAVPIPERPGSQLYVADPAAADRLMPIVLPVAQSGRITWAAGDHHRLMLRAWYGVSYDSFIDDATALAAAAATRR